jgi:hypothetical protein
MQSQNNNGNGNGNIFADRKVYKCYNTNKHAISVAEGIQNDEKNKKSRLINPQLISTVEGRNGVFLGNKNEHSIEFEVKINNKVRLPCCLGHPYDDIKGLPSHEELKDIDFILGNFVTSSAIFHATGKPVIGPDTFHCGLKDVDDNIIGVTSLIKYPTLDFENKSDNWIDAVVNDSDRKKYNASSLVISAPTSVFYDRFGTCVYLTKLEESFVFGKDRLVALSSSSSYRKSRYLLDVDNSPQYFDVKVHVSGAYDTVVNLPPVYVSDFVSFGSSATPTYAGYHNTKVVLVPESVALIIQQFRPAILNSLCVVSGNGNEGAVRDDKGVLIGYKSFKLWSSIDRFPEIINRVTSNNNNNNNNNNN